MHNRVPRPDRPPRVSWAISSDQNADAFDTYRGSFADLYEVGDVAHAGKADFSSRTTVHLFGSSVIGRGRSVSQTLSRDAAMVRRSGLDHISLIINLAETVGDSDGKSVRAEAGSVQFRDLSRPSASHTDRIDTLNIMIPRTSVPSWLLSKGLHGLVLPATSPGGRLVASHLLTVADVADGLSEAEGVAAIEAAFVIAERFMGHERSIAPAHTDAIHRSIRERAMTLMDAEPVNGRWTSDTLARAMGVSRTSLYRAFETTGGVKAYVLSRRLSRAYAELRARKGNLPTVEHIGQMHGFPDRRTFVAAFRQRFGMSPDDVPPSNPQASRLAQDGSELPMDRAMHDVVMDWLRTSEAA